MGSGGITKDGLPKSKINRRGLGVLRVKANSAMCVQRGKWTLSRCTVEKRATPVSSQGILLSGNVKRTLER